MKRVEDVGVGHVMVTRERIVLRALALGSCIGVSAYDPVEKIGGMAHVMLPDSAPDKAAEKTRYAENAIDEMIRRMIEMGARLSNLQVCLVGGGNVLERDDDTICQSNMASVRKILEDKNLAVKALSLGGTKRKSVLLEIDNGRISYTEGDEKEKVLWQVCDEQTGRI